MISQRFLDDFRFPRKPTDRPEGLNMIHRLSIALMLAVLLASVARSAEPEPAPAVATRQHAHRKPSIWRSFPIRSSWKHRATISRSLPCSRRDDDVTLDVTEAAQWKLADETFAKMEGNRILPVADGETELICQHGNGEVRIPVKVTKSAETLPVSFEKDIVPILTRSGCNTGSCHGAASGKDGFMITLFGYDPAGDYKRITREIGMRRINLAVPEDSLLLTKSTGKVPHTGGKLFDEDSIYYKTILEWLTSRRTGRSHAAASVDKLEIFPPNR